MKLPLVIFFIIVVNYSNIFLNMIKAESSLLCTPCHGEECDMTFGTCRFGTYRNFCGQLSCSKGPNQTCGGLFDERGRCGDGLMCRCSVCTGCSSDTLECYYRHCKPNHLDNLDSLTASIHYPFNLP